MPSAIVVRTPISPTVNAVVDVEVTQSFAVKIFEQHRETRNVNWIRYKILRTTVMLPRLLLRVSDGKVSRKPFKEVLVCAFELRILISMIERRDRQGVERTSRHCHNPWTSTLSNRALDIILYILKQVG